MLSCDCSYDGDFYIEEYQICVGEGCFEREDFKPLATKRRRRCCSCEKLIDLGETCLRFRQWRSPNCDYEEGRFGFEVELADLYHCEHCGEIWLNLIATGMCVTFGDMREALQEYWEMTGFDPAKYQAGAA